MKRPSQKNLDTVGISRSAALFLQCTVCTYTRSFPRGDETRGACEETCVSLVFGPAVQVAYRYVRVADTDAIQEHSLAKVVVISN
jgi:hypothetical protein